MNRRRLARLKMDLWLRYRRTWWWPWLPWAPAILIPALALIVTAVEVWGR